jgi:hypothetical protein
MDGNKCKLCNEKVSEDNRKICLNCGAVVCKDDYDIDSGYCTKCLDDCSCCGC